MRRGLALLVTLPTAGALVLLASLLFDASFGMQRWALHSGDRWVARAAASGGIDDGLYELDRDPGWSGGFQGRVLPSGAIYNVTVSRQITPDFRPVPAGWVHLTAVALYGDSVQRQEAFLTDRGEVRRW